MYDPDTVDPELRQYNPGLLVQIGRKLWKVSERYQHSITMQQVYPVPARTTVRTFTRDDLIHTKEPSDRMMAKYEEAYDR